MPGYWSSLIYFLFFHFTLMMLFRAPIPRILLRSQHSTVGRPWIGAMKDIVFSSRQTWVQMPTLPLISLWDWSSSVISLVLSFLVFKIESATCFSKFTRLKWTWEVKTTSLHTGCSSEGFQQAPQFPWDHKSYQQAPDTNPLLSDHSLGATSLPEWSAGCPAWKTHLSCVHHQNSMCQNIWDHNTWRASLHRLNEHLFLNTHAQK